MLSTMSDPSKIEYTEEDFENLRAVIAGDRARRLLEAPKPAVLTSEGIEKLRSLAAAATPGPWKPCGASDSKCPCGLLWAVIADSVLVHVPKEGSNMFEEAGCGTHADLDFIAAARLGVPSLILTIEKLQLALKEACALADMYIHPPDLQVNAPKQPEISTWSVVVTSDWTKPFRDKDRVAELAKITDNLLPSTEPLK